MKKRAAADGHEAFGSGLRQGTKARAEARGEEKRLSGRSLAHFQMRRFWLKMIFEPSGSRAIGISRWSLSAARSLALTISGA